VYVFKHALTQEVAYHSLVRETRQQYHRQIAEVLVERFAARVETQPEVVAHHYTEAGRSAQAIPYWQRAGERAAERSAYHEVVMHCTRGLAVLQNLPETLERARCELGLQVTLGSSQDVIRGPSAPEVGHAFNRAHELCEHLGDTAQLSRVLRGLFPFHATRGGLRVALEIAEQHLRLAQRQHNDFLRSSAHAQMGFALFFRGALAPARPNFERAMALYDPQQPGGLELRRTTDLRVYILSHLAWNLSVLGYPDQAARRIREALTWARDIAHPFSLVYALLHAVQVHELRREFQTVQEHAEAMIALCAEQEFVFWWGWGMFYKGWALVAQGHGEAGVAQMRQGITRLAHAQLMGPYGQALLAEAYAHRGQTAEGWAVLTETLAAVEQSEGRFYTAELHRLKGELLLRQAMTNAPQAEACFRQALALARRSQAKWWELRAAISLSRLWQRQGRSDAARQLLAEVYGWFTEGFDTADLQEARALLHEL
jgi:predicted ATPase